MTLLESQALYLESLRLRHLAPNTIRIYKECLGHFNRYCKSCELDDPRNATLQDLLNFGHWIRAHRKPNGQPFSIKYQNRNIRTAKALFKYLHETGAILTDITRHMPVLKTPKTLPRDILTKEEVILLLRQPTLSRATGFRDRTILEILYSCALRGGELLKLTAYDIDHEDRTLRILQAKGNKDRIVPVGNIAWQYLEEYTRTVHPILKARSHLQNLFLIHPKQLYYSFKLYCEQAGLPETVSPHSLRHTCATELLRAGASIRHVQELLGHASVKTTQIYTHVILDDLEKAHRRTAPSEKEERNDSSSFNSKTAKYRQDKVK
jgi:integrase/recombinase XerD